MILRQISGRKDDQINEDTTTTASSTHGEDDKILAGKLEGKRQLGRQSRRWEC
jgi:hypothetical protein